MFLYIPGLAFSDISFLESLSYGSCSSNSVFTLATNKPKDKLPEIPSKDRILSQGISLK